MKGFIKVVLPNGLRIVLVPRAHTLAATMLVLVEAGSEYETKDINGLSHFLEHMCFKGTTKRPRPGAIAEELDALGADYNAFTGEEYTGYWAKAEYRKLPQLVDIVSDLYLNPVFVPEEIEKERGVIIGEINMYEDTPTRKVHDLFTSLLYGDQPAGWDIAGTKDNIMRLSREDFVTYRSAHYVAPKTVVVVSGNFNAPRILSSLKSIFGNLPHAKRLKKKPVHESQSKPAFLGHYKKLDQSHLVLGVRAFDMFDPRRYALEVMANVLGGGMSSRLFKRIREDLGAAYYVRADASCALDYGSLSVSVGAHHEKLDVVIRTVCEELSRFKSKLVGEAELKKSKDHLIGGTVLGLETSDALGTFYGFQELLRHKVDDPDMYMKKIREVTAKDIMKVARALVIEKGLNLALIGPEHEGARFKKLLRFP